MNERIGLSTIGFRTLGAEEALERIAKLGFETIDLGVAGEFCPHFDPSKLESMDVIAITMDRLGLKAATLNTVPSAFGEKDHDKLLELVGRCIELAARVGAYGVTVDGGFPRTEDWNVGASHWADFLARSFALGEKAGVELSVEIPHRGSFGQSVEEAGRLVELLPDGMGITADTSHVVIGGSDASSFLDGFSHRIRHVHLRDAVGADINYTPGDGEFDFAGFIPRLEQLGYRGAYCLELEYGEKGLSHDEIESEALRATKFVEGILSGGDS